MKALYRAALGALLGGLIGFFAITPAFAGDHHDARVRKAQAAASSTPTEKTTASPTYTAKPVSPVTGSSTTTEEHHCKVTADRGAGMSFIVHNGCLDSQRIIVSLQSQPGPWHKGLCEETGKCELLKSFPVDVPPGDHTYTWSASSCFYQVDLKWHGTLIRSNHFTNECSTPTTSTTTTSTTSSSTSRTPTSPTRKAPVCDSDNKTQTTDDDCLAFTGATPLTRILMILGPAIIIGGAMMRFAPWSRAGKH